MAATVDKARLEAVSLKCSLIAAGQHFEVKTPVNGFKYPKNIEADIPRVIVAKSIDFRSEALPNAGYAVCRNRRKKPNATEVIGSTTISDSMEI